MKSAKVKFKISISKDVDTFFDFASEVEMSGEAFFDQAIWNEFPAWKPLLKGPPFNRADVARLVRGEYRAHADEIKRGVEAAERDWRRFEPRYYKLVAALFGDDFWPSGKYTCYPTIWGMYPRFLEDKTYQIPYSHSIKN
ncbi:MAG: hypothetical protein WCJ29_05265 [bacterium]